MRQVRDRFKDRPTVGGRIQSTFSRCVSARHRHELEIGIITRNSHTHARTYASTHTHTYRNSHCLTTGEEQGIATRALTSFWTFCGRPRRGRPRLYVSCSLPHFRLPLPFLCYAYGSVSNGSVHCWNACLQFYYGFSSNVVRER